MTASEGLLSWEGQAQWVNLRLKLNDNYTPRQRRLYRSFKVCMWILSVATARLGPRRCHQWLSLIPARPGAPGLSASELVELRNLAQDAAGRGTTGAACLEISFLLFAYLRWQGEKPTVNIGVRKMSGKIHSHAWTVCNQRVVSELGDPRSIYKVMPLLEAK
jgi:hypothetical protein